jgi:hypothetical protein
MAQTRRVQSLLLLAAAALCFACAKPGPSATELAQQNLAQVVIESPAAWNLGAPPGKALTVDIAKLDDTDVCKPETCPTELDVPAGKHTLVFRCVLFMGNLSIPRVEMPYTGDFTGGHHYEVRPTSTVPDCKIQVEDAGPSR